MSLVRLVNTSQQVVHIFAITARRANINLQQDKPSVPIAPVANLIHSSGELALPHVSIVQQDRLQRGPRRWRDLHVVLTHTEHGQVAVLAPHARAGQPRSQAAQRCRSA